MATSIEIKMGSVEAIPPSLTATAIGADGTELIDIPCGFTPTRVSIILDGTVAKLMEFALDLTGYFRMFTGASELATGVLVVPTETGFAIDSSLEGAGDYYITAWR